MAIIKNTKEELYELAVELSKEMIEVFENTEKLQEEILDLPYADREWLAGMLENNEFYQQAEQLI